MIRNWTLAASRSGCVLAIVSAIVNSSLAKQETQPYRYYFVEAAVVSLDASQSLSSYSSHGRVSGAPGATIGCSTPDTNISIALLVESNHFYADVTLKSNGKTGDRAANKQRVDLTNLRPTSVEVGAEKDGRTYQLNLVPSIKTVQLTPKPFQEIADDLYRLKFHSSSVTLNDKQFIGRMLASDSEMLWVDICGVAHLEFSLHHLKNAKPWGRLQNGQITFSHPDGTTIEISNVTNGVDDRVVEGGPYVVWVRWNKPKESVEEFRAALKAQREPLKASAGGAGSDDTVARALAIIDQELAREPGPWVTSCGAGGPQKDDIIRDE